MRAYLYSFSHDFQLRNTPQLDQDFFIFIYTILNVAKTFEKKKFFFFLKSFWTILKFATYKNCCLDLGNCKLKSFFHLQNKGGSLPTSQYPPPPFGFGNRSFKNGKPAICNRGHVKHIKVKGKKGKKGKTKETYDLIVNIDLVRFLLHSVENYEFFCLSQSYVKSISGYDFTRIKIQSTQRKIDQIDFT